MRVIRQEISLPWMNRPSCERSIPRFPPSPFQVSGGGSPALRGQSSPQLGPPGCAPPALSTPADPAAAHVPPAALPYFANPLLLVQVRPQMETAFARFPGGTALLQTLFDNVRASLASGLHLIFVCSAVIMSLGVLLHLALRSEPLRTRTVEPEPAVHCRRSTRVNAELAETAEAI